MEQHNSFFFRDGKTYLQGYFVKNVWRDEKTGSSFFFMQTEQEPVLEEMYREKKTIYDRMEKRNITWYSIYCNAGKIAVPVYEEYMPIIVSGEFQPTEMNDGRYDFFVETIEETSAEAQLVVNYLSRQCGMSSIQAYDIYQALDGDVFEGVFRDDVVDTVVNATGMTQRKAQSIITALRESVVDRKLFSQLAPFKVSYTDVRHAIKLYGEQALEKLKERPWTRGLNCGMSFLQCDSFAKFIGKESDDQDRIQAISNLAVGQFTNSGHVYYPMEKFTNIFQKIASSGAYKEYVSISGGEENKNIHFVKIGGEDSVVSVPLAMAEERIAKNIVRLCGDRAENPWNGQLSVHAEEECGMSFGKQQNFAFTLLQTKGVKILTGGPGTGKTTTLKGLIHGYLEMYPDAKIKLFAPTGRAAQRMSESCGYPAVTVHRGLDYRPYGDNVSHKDRNNPIDADMVIVDEMSMMDVPLFDIFLEAIKTGTTLLLVGDIHQLESVGPGAILHDLLCGGNYILDSVMLTEVFRQGKDSPIIGNAMRINSGDTRLRECSDFQVIQAEDSQETGKVIKDLMKELYVPDDPFAVQVLCPSWKGEAGITALNKELQEMLNPRPSREKLYHGGVSYGVGDKIIMMTNNYEADYYNGDIGVVKAVSRNDVTVTIRGEDFRINRSDLGEMSLAYAMSIHKSQGSEFPTVITSMPMQPNNMLVRNLLYTAVTRAKKKDIIVNEGNAIDIATATDKSGTRQTFLSAFLRGVKYEDFFTAEISKNKTERRKTDNVQSEERCEQA